MDGATRQTSSDRNLNFFQALGALEVETRRVMRSIWSESEIYYAIRP